MSIREKIGEEVDRIRRETEQYKPSNEAHTCDIVIKPLIYACGYSPYEVVPQAADAVGGRPDYTIMPNTDYRWYLEAKDWSIVLKSDNAVQALNYANQNGGRWVVLTNGREWRVYDNSIMGVAVDKEIYTAKIDNTDELAELLTSLSKESVMNGGLEAFARNARIKKVLDKELKDEKSAVIKSIANALKKMDGLPGVKPADVANYFKGAKMPPVIVVESHTVVSKPEDDTPHSLTELNNMSLSYSKPEIVYFPDRSPAYTSSWKDAVVRIIEYILSVKDIPPLPYSGIKGGFRCFLNFEPVYLNGDRMIGNYGEVEILGRKVYIDTNRSADNFMKQLVKLCTDMGLQPSDFRIKVRPAEKNEK